MTLKQGQRGWRCKEIDTRLRPFVGSGLSLAQVGEQTGVSAVAVWKALKVRGWSLKKDQRAAP